MAGFSEQIQNLKRSQSGQSALTPQETANAQNAPTGAPPDAGNINWGAVGGRLKTAAADALQSNPAWVAGNTVAGLVPGVNEQPAGSKVTLPMPPTPPTPPAKFVNAPSGPGSPPSAVNPSGGTMSILGSPSATATIGPTGAVTENVGWRTATAPGTATGQGQIPGVGGTLNVMTPEQNAAVSGTPQGGGTPGQGEVWAGKEGQALRESLTNNMNLAMKKANAPYTAERGTSAETGGNRQQWANLAHQFGETLSGGMAAQGAEREAAAGHAITGALTPSEIEKNKGVAEYYGTHGEALLQTAAAKEEMAKNQLEIAGLKAGAGKYGNTAEASDYLKGEGFAPNPQAIEAFNKGGKVVPGVKATTSMFRPNTPAIPKHMIPSDWKPTMDANGKPKVTPNGLPLYTDAAGNANRQPTIIGK
jgi:hypothetical protein